MGPCDNDKWSPHSKCSIQPRLGFIYLKEFFFVQSGFILKTKIGKGHLSSLNGLCVPIRDRADNRWCDLNTFYDHIYNNYYKVFPSSSSVIRGSWSGLWRNWMRLLVVLMLSVLLTSTWLEWLTPFLPTQTVWLFFLFYSLRNRRVCMIFNCC